MKRSHIAVAVFIIICTFAGMLWAKDTKSVAILPFTINSSDNIDWAQQATVTMLDSRLSSNSKIGVIARDKVSEAVKGKKTFSEADIYTLGKKLNADYVVWGSISKIGNNLSIDGKLTDIKAYKPAVGFSAISHGYDEMIPKINDFAQKINDSIMGISTAAPAMVSAPVVSSAPASPQASTASAPARESEIIAGIRKNPKGTYTAALNPDFINAYQPVDRKGFWMSESIPTEIRGMDVGDVNGDGLNEIVTIDRNSIRIWQKKGKDFRMLQKIAGKSYNDYYSVDVADIKKTGVKQIYVTNLGANNQPLSFVIEWKDGKFVETSTKLPWFIRVVNTSTGQKLLGQRLGIVRPFDSPIHEIVWEDGKFKEGTKMKIPQGLPVYNFAMDILDVGGSEKIIAINSDDYLCFYEPTDKPLERLQTFGGPSELLYRSDDIFGGNNLYVEYTGQEYDGAAYEENRTFINIRMLTHDFGKRGKKEILVVRNGAPGGRLLKKVKVFTSSEIFDLEWDGLGMVENWRTKKINGAVADIQFKDVDNDGDAEIVIALIMSSGKMMGERSVIVAYKMTVSQPATQPGK